MMNTNGVHCQVSTMTSVRIAISIEPSQSGGMPELLDDPVDHAPVRVEQRAPHHADDDRRHQHRQQQDAADDPRAAEIRLKNSANAMPSTTWSTTAPPTMIALFLAAFQNSGSASRSRVVVEPDPLPVPSSRRQVGERQAQAVDQRVDREGDEIEDARPEQEQDVAALAAWACVTNRSPVW